MHHLRLLPLALSLLAGCSSERRDRLWRTLDPAGYKHSHSASFHPDRYQQSKLPPMAPATDERTLELTQ